MDWKEIKEKDNIRKRFTTEYFVKRLANDKEAERRKNPSEDTKIRMEIQKFIMDNCYVKKLSKEQVLEQLNEKYGDSKYLKYRIYFESWVNNALCIKEDPKKGNSDNKQRNDNVKEEQQER